MRRWTQRGPGFLAVVVLLVATAAGCKDEVTRSGGETITLGPQASPESVLVGLETAYRERDTPAYESLLADDFRFVFRPDDAYLSPSQGYWTREEETANTACLFDAQALTGISIQLDRQATVDSLGPGEPGGAKMIPVVAHLELDDLNGTTYVLYAGVQDMYFRKGLLQNADEDTSLWYLYAWREVQSSFGASGPAERAITARPLVESVTWGRLKVRYRCPASYEPQTSPENVVQNLQLSYEQRNIKAYGKLLAPELRFYFQDADVPFDLGRTFWVHDEDSTGTANLFGTPQVNAITINLTYSGAIVPTEIGLPPGAMKIRALAHLEVDDVNGTTYVVDGDIEDFYFRKGILQNAGEDTTSWYLFEWHDIRRYASPAGNSAGVRAVATQHMSWGKLKTQYK